ncbi:MAG: DUF4268 domain-containing protein [Alteraurantiacibacter sp.]
MSMTPKLGRLVTLKATEVWGNEPQVFTPWLSENLDLLAEALQIDELELKGTEVAAGDFRLDILAHDAEGHPVLIENQFGATDHRHLGQLISYVASQSGQATVVWVAERFKDDHRAAIDWLNANTIDDFGFFAVEIEALQIGDSDPAPFFNVVAKPNAWARSVGAVTRQSTSGDEPERHRTRLAYWTSFSEFLKERKSAFSIRRPGKDHWHSFSAGRSGVVISNTIYTKKKRIGVELYFHNDPLKIAIRQLASEKAMIEAEFGEPLEWQELPTKKASRIALFREGCDPADTTTFPQQHEWMLSRMDAFRRVFGPRIRALDLTGPAEPEEEGDES